MEQGAFLFSLIPEEVDQIERYGLRGADSWKLYWWDGYLEDPRQQPIQSRLTAVLYDTSGRELDRITLTDRFQAAADNPSL